MRGCASVARMAFAAMSLAVLCAFLSCGKPGQASHRDVYGVTCYSAGQAILDTESDGRPERPYGAEFSTISFTEHHTGKWFRVTGDCIIAKE